jgi:drug/metabolite transporter (DMT)-like permease
VPRGLVADLLLVLVCFFWGATFVLVKEAVSQVPVSPFLALRFLLAGLLLSLIFPRRLAGAGRGALGAGALLGAVLFGGYALQTYGLARTSASNAGFITGLSVVLVPVFSALAFRARTGAGAWTGVGLATAGLYLLSGGLERLNLGDLFVLGCAVCFAWHIILTGRFARAHDPAALATLQVLATGLLAAAGALLFEGGIPLALPPLVWWAVIITSLFATVFAFLVQTVAQRFTSATRTALIFTTEPVFAALVAWGWAGEPVTGWAVAGGTLVVLAMIVAELAPAAAGEGAKPAG